VSRPREKAPAEPPAILSPALHLHAAVSVYGNVGAAAIADGVPDDAAAEPHGGSADTAAGQQTRT
jgi:hypothetical protein